MENFGVVPLFLSLAFLTLPLLVALILRLRSVTLVLETILITPLLLPLTLYASDANTKMIAIGELLEIPLNNLSKFTVGNGDVLTYKVSDDSKSLLIKGKQLGQTELIIWQNGGKVSYSIYVIDKRTKLSLFTKNKYLSDLGLKPTTTGSTIMVKGEVKDILTYRALTSFLSRETNKDIVVNITLNKKLANHIIGEVYYAFFQEYIDNIQCNLRDIRIICYYPKDTKPSATTLKHLRQNFNVEILPGAADLADNYSFNLQLFQLDNLAKKGLSLDLSKGLENFISANKGLASTLAKTNSIIHLDSPFSIEVGVEVPFSIIQEQIESVQWKFVGLKIDATFKKIQDDFKIEYTIIYSNPTDGQQIIVNRETSAAFVNLDKPLELFKIDILNTGSFRNFGLSGKTRFLDTVKGLFGNSTSSKNVFGIVQVSKI